MSWASFLQLHAPMRRAQIATHLRVEKPSDAEASKKPSYAQASKKPSYAEASRRKNRKEHAARREIIWVAIGAGVLGEN